VGLHGPCADAEITGDLSVGPPQDDEPQHVALARRERVEAQPKIGDLGPIPPRVAVAEQRTVDGVKQHLVIDWPLKEIDGAGLDRAHARWHVGVTTDEDDRDVVTGPMRLSWSSSPLGPGRRKSSTTQAGRSGIGVRKKSWADA
jgi:hypothetical protein